MEQNWNRQERLVGLLGPQRSGHNCRPRIVTLPVKTDVKRPLTLVPAIDCLLSHRA